MTDLDLARSYYNGINAAANSAVSGEEEAQLTVPVSNLLSALADAHGLGKLGLIRETRLGGTRPDFAAVLQIGRRTLKKWLRRT